MKPKYVLCPRCELNYMPTEDPSRKYCDICLAELKLIDQSVLIPEDEESDLILCPKCKINYINADEDICDACREADKKVHDVEDDPTVWTPDFTEEEPIDDEPVEISFDEVAEEEEEEASSAGEPFDEEDTFADDFEVVDIDSPDLADDIDDEDEEEFEEEEKEI